MRGKVMAMLSQYHHIHHQTGVGVGGRGMALPGSPLGPPSYGGEGGGGYPIGEGRSPGGSGRSKRQRMEEMDSRMQVGVMPSPQPLLTDVHHHSSLPSVPAFLPSSYPPMGLMLPPQRVDRGVVEHSMLLDHQGSRGGDGDEGGAQLHHLHSELDHHHPLPGLSLRSPPPPPHTPHPPHHHQNHFISFNPQLSSYLRGGAMGLTPAMATMATPVSSSLPTISAVTLASPSSVFASARSVTSVSPAPSLSSVSSASSPSLATPTKSCFSRTSSSASSTPRTDDSGSIDESFHSSVLSADDSEPHLTEADKPYACADCHKRFSSQHRLTTHRRCHLNARPYQCTLCSKEFNHKGSLTRHMRTHNGDKPHECTTCHKRFFQPGNLTVHIRTHTGEKPFACDQCGKRFNHRSSLTVHSRSHFPTA